MKREKNSRVLSGKKHEKTLGPADYLIFSIIGCNFADMEQMTTKEIVREGAEKGAWLGLIFIALFAATIGNLYVPILSFVILAIVVAVPIVAYRMLRRTYIKSGCALSMPSVWLQGIVMFLCGSLMLAVAVYLYTQIIAPHFISNMIDYLREMSAVTDNQQLAEQAVTLNSLIAETGIPRPIDMALGMAWTGTFSGTILSLLLSAFVKIMSVKVR